MQSLCTLASGIKRRAPLAEESFDLTVPGGLVRQRTTQGRKSPMLGANNRFCPSRVMQLAQTEVYYYGYWVYDPAADYYYWFPADVVIVDTTWVDYIP
jgi:hypothetical protein